MPARCCLHSVGPLPSLQSRPTLAHRPNDTRLPEAAHRAQAPRLCLQIILYRSIRSTWMRTAISPCLSSRATPSSQRNTFTASTIRRCATAARFCIAASLRRTSSATKASELCDRCVAPEHHSAFCDCAQLRRLSMSSQVRADHPPEQDDRRYGARHSHARQGQGCLSVPKSAAPLIDTAQTLG